MNEILIGLLGAVVTYLVQVFAARLGLKLPGTQPAAPSPPATPAGPAVPVAPQDRPLLAAILRLLSARASGETLTPEEEEQVRLIGSLVAGREDRR